MFSSTRSSVRVGVATVLAGVLLLAACQTDTTQEQQSEPELPEDELAIENPWVRPASQGDSTVLYMTLANGQAEADTLTGARAPIFDNIQIYTTTPDTAAQVQPGSTLVVDANARTSLNPEGPYVVLRNIDQSLSDGETVLITLEFARGELRQVRAPVQTSASSSEQ